MNTTERAKNIILRPKTEWAVIAAEPLDVASVYRGYIIPLSLIPIVASFIGTSLIGYSVPGLPPFRIPVLAGLISGVIQFGLGLAFVYVLALAIDALAPLFNARKSMSGAFKLATYALTPAWLAGIFSILPGLTIFTLLGLYFVYLIYIGLPRLMAAPQEKVLIYTLVIFLVVLVLTAVSATVAGLFIPASARTI